MSSGTPAGAAHATPDHGGGHDSHGTKKSKMGPRGWTLFLVVVVFCGWFYWPRIQAKMSEWRTPLNSSTSKESKEDDASPSGSAEAKSGSNIPDVSRGVSDVLSGIPALLFGVTKKQDPPRPPGTVYEMWVRPGVIVWAGKISRSQPSPWFEVMETVFAAIDTDGEGVQRKEFFPGNPHIFRWVEQESDTPLPAAAFGEEVP